MNIFLRRLHKTGRSCQLIKTDLAFVAGSILSDRLILAVRVFVCGLPKNEAEKNISSKLVSLIRILNGPTTD